MLILGRKVGEVIYIGEGNNLIEIAVLGLDNGQARLGINAPKNVPIHRAEVRDRVTSENPYGRSAKSIEEFQQQLGRTKRKSSLSRNKAQS